MTARPFICFCGHPRSWHRRPVAFGTEVCLLCAVCGELEHEHHPAYGREHPFTECDCGGDAQGTASRAEKSTERRNPHRWIDTTGET